MNDVQVRKQSIDLCRPLTSKMAAAIQFAIEYSIYSPSVSATELTTAQGLMLSLFYNLLQGDKASVIALISFVDYLPQMRSSFISVWLRDDYRFCQKHVAKVLTSLAQLMIEEKFIVPHPVVSALIGLEEKYDVFNYLYQSGDTTAQYLLACLNPLVTRATQVGSDGVQDKDIEVKPATESISTQTAVEDLFEGEPSQLNSTRKSSSSVDEMSVLNVEEQLQSRSPITPPHQPVNNIRLSSGPEMRSPSRSNAEKKLLCAVRQNDLAAASSALAAGARPDCCDRWDWTPLHLAAERGYCRMINLLIASGATVNSTTVANATALHYAASSGHLNCSLKLLNSGADPNAKNRWGLTPVQKALERRHVAVANLIKSRSSY